MSEDFVTSAAEAVLILCCYGMAEAMPLRIAAPESQAPSKEGIHEVA
jgi:hypothetical protein